MIVWQIAIVFQNGTKLHAESFGNPDSAIVIVLYGGPCSDYRYLLNCKEFADEGSHVVFYDQRGSGLSKRHCKSCYSIQVMLDEVSAVITHYRKSPAQKVFLLGHSWGAMLATLQCKNKAHICGHVCHFANAFYAMIPPAQLSRE